MLTYGILPSSAAASIYFFKPPYAIGSVPSLSGHALAYRWRSLPRVRRHRASKPQGSSQRVLPWQVTMDQLICASLSHTHYWYDVTVTFVPLCDHEWDWHLIGLWPTRGVTLVSSCDFSFFSCNDNTLNVRINNLSHSRRDNEVVYLWAV